MAKTSFFFLLILTLSLAAAGGPLVSPLAQQNPNRLNVINNTSNSVDVYVYRYDGYAWNWIYMTSVVANTQVPLYGISQGESFRALLHSIQQYRYHNVNLVYDQAYGGYQDTWAIYEQ